MKSEDLDLFKKTRVIRHWSISVGSLCSLRTFISGVCCGLFFLGCDSMFSSKYEVDSPVVLTLVFGF
jgi:hypothetical protein